MNKWLAGEAPPLEVWSDRDGMLRLVGWAVLCPPPGVLEIGPHGATRPNCRRQSIDDRKFSDRVCDAPIEKRFFVDVGSIVVAIRLRVCALGAANTAGSKC
jgi:hypothetical protein